MKKLKAAGKAPEKIVMAVLDGAVGHFNKAFPNGAPTVLDLWEQETGVKVEMISVSLDAYAKMLQDVTTEAGLYDIYALLVNYYGDFYDAGGLIPLDDYVAKHQPDWTDPERGVPNEQVYNLLYKHDDRVVGLSFDGDFYTWHHRKDLFADPTHQSAFSDKYGYALKPRRRPGIRWTTWRPTSTAPGSTATPTTWARCGDSGPGSSGMPAWPIRTCTCSIWRVIRSSIAMRGSTPPRSTFEYAKYSGDGASFTWVWFEAYGSMGAGTSAMMDCPPNLAKFLDRPDENSEEWLATTIGGKLDVHLPVGRQFGDELVRRGCLSAARAWGYRPRASIPRSPTCSLNGPARPPSTRG